MTRYQPALLGGLFIGVLSALPVVNTANLCCCLWVIVGGVLTSLSVAAGTAGARRAVRGGALRPDRRDARWPALHGGDRP